MWPEPAARRDRILAVRLDNVGDVVLLAPALRALKEAGTAHLTLLCSPAGAQAAPLLPWVDETIEWRVSWQDISGRLAGDPSGDLALIERLREGAYDAAVVFTSFSQSSHPPAYACYLGGIPVRAAHASEFAGAVLTQAVEPPPIEMHQAERNMHLLRALGIPAEDTTPAIRVPSDARDNVRTLLEVRRLNDAPFTLVVPGAGASARRYPARSFAQVVSLLAEDGRSVVVAGSARERALVRAVAGAHPRAVSLAGKTSVPELAALVTESAVVVANDSGAMHLADAAGTPVVATFSGTDLASQWAPRRVPSSVLTCPTTCSPCYAYSCPREKECLAIPPRVVADEALRLGALRSPAAVGTGGAERRTR